MIIPVRFQTIIMNYSCFVLYSGKNSSKDTNISEFTLEK